MKESVASNVTVFRAYLVNSKTTPWFGFATEAFAHAVTEGDRGYIQEISGVNLLPFPYLGARHMMTRHDHILFFFGVIFFLYRMKDIGIDAER